MEPDTGAGEAGQAGRGSASDGVKELRGTPWFLLGLAILITGLMVVHVLRLWFGVDTTDESFYCAMPFRFLLGDAPFLDEIDIHQTTSFLHLPFLWIYRSFMGNLDGVILYMRFVFLFASAMAAASVFLSLRSLNDLDPWTAALLSLSCIFFVPAGLPALNYDNLASLSLSVVLFAILAQDAGALRRPVLTCFGSGIVLAVSIVAYPPLLPMAGAVMLLLGIKNHRLTWKPLLLFLGGLGIPFVLVSGYLVSLGLPGVVQALSYALQGPNLGGREKLFLVLSGFEESFPRPLITIPYLTIAAVAFRRFGKASILSWLVVPIVFLPLLDNDFTAWWGMSRYVIYLGLLGPYLLVFTRDEDPLPRRILLYIWLPSFIAGCLTAWTSAMGYVKFAVGFFPATLATGWLLARILRTLPFPGRIAPAPASILPALSLIVLLLTFNLNFVYGEGSVGPLTSKVETGPFKGLMTQPEKAVFLTALEKSIQRHQVDGRILFYDFLPAGYLMTRSRPASNTVWQFHLGYYGATREALMEYLRVPEHHPKVVFRTKRVPRFDGKWLVLPHPARDPLEQWIRARYQNAEENDWYSVLTARSEP